MQEPLGGSIEGSGYVIENSNMEGDADGSVSGVQAPKDWGSRSPTQ